MRRKERRHLSGVCESSMEEILEFLASFFSYSPLIVLGRLLCLFVFDGRSQAEKERERQPTAESRYSSHKLRSLEFFNLEKNIFLLLCLLRLSNCVFHITKMKLLLALIPFKRFPSIESCYIKTLMISVFAVFFLSLHLH